MMYHYAVEVIYIKFEGPYVEYGIQVVEGEFVPHLQLGLHHH